ncbi:hypothetical protein KZ850_23450, partial [Pseudomonas aeruginosa]|nr:hypothetical protein [Pseudomonas aeruginosa]
THLPAMQGQAGDFTGGQLFFFKQKTAYEVSECLVGSEMCIRDSSSVAPDDRAGLVLGFAAVPEARIDEALRALRKAWRREALVGPVVATD